MKMTKSIADTHAPGCERRRGAKTCTTADACGEFRRQVSTMRRTYRALAGRDADLIDGLHRAEDGHLY